MPGVASWVPGVTCRAGVSCRGLPGGGPDRDDVTSSRLYAGRCHIVPVAVRSHAARRCGGSGLRGQRDGVAGPASRGGGPASRGGGPAWRSGARGAAARPALAGRPSLHRSRTHVTPSWCIRGGKGGRMSLPREILDALLWQRSTGCAPAGNTSAAGRLGSEVRSYPGQPPLMR
jgi:hypothetical protein